MFLLFFLWPAALVDTSGPPMADSVLLAAIRLVDHHTWTLTDRADPEVVFLTEAHDISVGNGRIYSGVGPGASVVAAPFYAVFKPLLSRFDDGVIASQRMLTYYMANSRARGEPNAAHLKDVYILQILMVWCLVAPLFAWLLVRLYASLTFCGTSRMQALVVVLAAGFGSMLVYYSSMYSRQALAYLLAWHALLSLLRTPAPGHRSCLIAGLLLGSAIPIDYPAAILVAWSLLCLLPRVTGPRRATILASVLASVALTALYHQAAFGSPFTTPYHHRFWYTHDVLARQGVNLSEFQQGPALGMNAPEPTVMLRLCFGRFKGLFVQSPILLLGLIGHLIGLRAGSGRRWHVCAILIFLIYLLFNSTLGTHVPAHGHHYWGGLGTLWGPRYLLAVVPVLACGLARLDWRKATLRWLAGALLLISVGMSLLGLMFRQAIMAAPAFGADLGNPIAFVFRSLFERGPRVTLLEAYGASPILQAAALCVLVLVSVVVLGSFRRAGEEGSGP